MHIAIVGNGIAVATAIRIMRINQNKTRVSIYTDEEHPYYPRPKLYEVLLGKDPHQIYLFPKEWYKKRNIELYLKRKVSIIDIKNKEVIFENHSRVAYDKLLLANGASPFIPPIKGISKSGV